MSDRFAPLRARIKDAAGRVLFGAADRVLPERYTRYSGPARHVRETLLRHRVGAVVDVGANTGGYRDFLRRRCGYRGLVVSFEPVPELAAELRRRAAADPLWVVMECALGAEDGSRAINVMRNSVFNSFLAPGGAAARHFDHNVVERVERVEVRRLDTLMRDLSARHGIGDFYLKMDTQGFDLEVLKGAEAVLDRVPALQTEIPVQLIYQGMPDWREAVARLEALGFGLSALFAISRDPVGRVVEFDCFAVNAARAGTAAPPATDQPMTEGSRGVA